MKIIDIHTHGIGGFDTRTTTDEHILKIAEIHGSRGVSEIIPTIYPASIETMRENMHTIKRAMEKQDRRGDRPPAPAKIIGINIEGPFLNRSKCGSLDAGSFLVPNNRDFKRLVEGFEDVIKIITVAPELAGAISLIKHISDMGIAASMGHSDATFSEAEEGYNAGARGITHIFNAMRGIHHREPGLAGFGLMHHDIYIEVIADPFHLDQQIIEFIFSAKDPDRIIIISDTVKESMAVSDSRGIRNTKDKLLGGSMTIKESASRLIEIGLDKEVVLRAISENPLRYLQTL